MRSAGKPPDQPLEPTLLRALHFYPDRHHMYRLLVTLAIFFCSGATSANEVSASNEWWSYLADYDGKPGSTRVDMALFREAPLPTFPTLVIVGTTYEKRPDSGLPTEPALASLNRTSDLLIRTVLAVQPGVYVGTYTNSGEQVHYIYTRSAEGVEPAFKSELSAQCSDCSPIFRTRPDPHWNAYLKFLYPNQATLDYYGFKPTSRHLKR